MFRKVILSIIILLLLVTTAIYFSNKYNALEDTNIESSEQNEALQNNKNSSQHKLTNTVSKLSSKATEGVLDYEVNYTTHSFSNGFVGKTDEISDLYEFEKKSLVKLSDNFSYLAMKAIEAENVYINLYENKWSVADGIFLKRTMPTRSLSEFADFVVGETSRDEIKAFDTPVDEIVEAKGLPIATMHLTNDGYAVIIGYVEDYLRDNNKNLVVASIAYVPMKSTKENEELLLSCLSPADKEAFEKNFEGGYYQFMQEFSIGGLYENSLYDYENLKIFVCEPLVSYSYMNHAFASLYIYWTDTAADRGAYFEDFDEHITLGEVTNNFTK